jgi:hypothetical protein
LSGLEVEDGEMARIVSGVVLSAWGLAILASALLRGSSGTGAYAAGQKMAWVFALGLIALGVRAIMKGRAARR